MKQVVVGKWMGLMVLGAVVVSACGSTKSSEGGTTGDDAYGDVGLAGDATATTDVGPGGDVSATAATFELVYTGVLAPSCATTGCHDAKGAKSSGNLDLSTKDRAFDQLVTQAQKDGDCPDTLRVAPGDHAKSSLWIRMTPDVKVTCGTAMAKMPDDMPALPQDQIDLVAAWIDAGAKK